MNATGTVSNLRWGPLDPDAYDEAVVQALLLERPVAARTVDYWEAVRRLWRERYTDGQIAARLRKRRRNVLRIRKRLGLPAIVGRYEGVRGPLDVPTLPKGMG